MKKSYTSKLIDFVSNVANNDDLAIDAVKCLTIANAADFRAAKKWWSKAVKTENGWESNA